MNDPLPQQGYSFWTSVPDPNFTRWTYSEPVPDVLMTVTDLAEFLNVSPRSIYRMVAEERIPCLRVGRQLRFHRQAVVKALEGWQK